MPSENVDSTISPDRRTRKRRARRDALLDLAAELVERDGVDGLTMAALAEAADYAPASLYTYFGSRSALLAALQRQALATLREVAEQHARRWDEHLAGTATSTSTAAPDRVAALARLWAFSDRFLAAPHEHPREFRLQQQLLVTPGAEDTADAASVVPAAMGVLDLPRRLLEDAQRVAALDDTNTVGDPTGSPLDPPIARTLAWIVAMNGALMADGLSTGLPTTGAALGRELTRALLVGWGAAHDDLAAARVVADELAEIQPAPEAHAAPEPHKGAPR